MKNEKSGRGGVYHAVVIKAINRSRAECGKPELLDRGTVPSGKETPRRRMVRCDNFPLPSNGRKMVPAAKVIQV